MTTSGAVIRKLRIDRGLTVTSLAMKAGITKGTVSLLESDQRRPSIDMARKLAKALNTSPAPIAFPELMAS